MRHLTRLFSIVVSLVAAGSAWGQAALQDLPEYERFQEMNRARQGLVQGGTVSDVRWAEDGSAVFFQSDGAYFAIDLNTLEKRAVNEGDRPAREPGVGRGRGRGGRGGGPPRGRQRSEEVSPDGHWIAASSDWNVSIRAAEGDDVIAVTTDGTRKFRYGEASWVYGEELRQREAMWWSDDSKKLVYYAFDERQVPDHYLASGLTDLHTAVLVEGYPKPGEPNPIANLHVYDMDSRQTMELNVNTAPEQYVFNVRFAPDGQTLLFNRTNRHQDDLEVIAVDLNDGSMRQVVREKQPCWQENNPMMRFLSDGQRFIWESEAGGWKHYQLRSLDGGLIVRLTPEGFPVESIVQLDEDSGWMYYSAFSGVHPLNAHLHRVRLDGTGQQRLTHASLSHRSFQISPDDKWFICQRETVETPPSTLLASTSGDRNVVLAQADISGMKEMGLSMPEMFTFKADDGVTDLYGTLFKPSNFDPQRAYPLLIDVYGGPLSQGVRNTFSPVNPSCEYGFMIAKIDNRGTRGRGKAFETAAYLKLGIVDIKDQADGVKFLRERPYIDGDRVGIYGHSYGGYMSALAVLKYPDVFQVASAGAPVTDWKNYDTIYTERFMRTPQENGENYEAGSCLTYADQLEGKLLILHGMVDDNVHPNNTFQLVEAIRRAGKRVDMQFWPNSGHGLGRGSNEARWEYLYHNLIATHRGGEARAMGD